jgi:flagellar biosynthesis GTPase FlhF
MEVAMRIKIKGEITAERLAEALHAAAEKYEAVRPGHKVYGANLYLTAFDADGLPFDLVDHRGEPLSITIEAKSGELVKPALTAEGEARRQKAKEEARRQAEEAEAEAQRRHRQTLDEYEQERQKRRKKEAEARKQFEDANAITAELLKTMPERFIEAKFAQRAKNVKLAIFLYRANIIGCLDPCQCIDQRCAFYTKVTTYSGFGHASFQRF